MLRTRPSSPRVPRSLSATPASPAGVSLLASGIPLPFMPGLCVGDRKARADCQCGDLIDRIAAGAPVRKLVFVEALGHARVPLLGHRPDHRAGVELAAIDTEYFAQYLFCEMMS